MFLSCVAGLAVSFALAASAPSTPTGASVTDPQAWNLRTPGWVIGHALDAGNGERLHACRRRGGGAKHALVHRDDGQLAEAFQELRRRGDHTQAERLILWPGSIGAKPAVADGKLIFGGTDGHLYALELAGAAGTPAPAAP